MYINDERETKVQEVIETSDDNLFFLVTGLSKSDFRKLQYVHGVFDDQIMNETILNFKYVEDNALVYLGDRTLEEQRGDNNVAVWNTHIKRL